MNLILTKNIFESSMKVVVAVFERYIAPFILFISVINYAQNISPAGKFSPPFYYYERADAYSDYIASPRYSIYNHWNAESSITRAKTAQFINSEKLLGDGTYWREQSDIEYLRLSSLLGAMAAVDLVAYMYQREVWYREETTAFHSLDFVMDWKKYQQMDKIGHFTDAYFTSDLAAKLYRWSGISGNSSVWLGALTGWLWMLQIEISDGFMAEWGFSWGDMLTNTLGSGFYLLQQFNYDLLGGIHPKFSWHKSEAWEEMRYTKIPMALIEDYEGMTFWVTVNPHHYFPDSWKRDYPQWLAPLGIAFGQSAKGVGNDPFGGYPEYFIGLDIDIRKIPVGDDSPVIRFLKSELNFIRLPLPAVRFSKNGTWFGFYF